MIYARIFLGTVPKDGNEEDENEDALCLHSWLSKHKLIRLRCAIADGATQASFSRLWANLLVESATKSKLIPSIKKTELLVNNSYETWESNLAGIELPWYAKVKASFGAFSSFLWVGINSSDKGNHANLSAVSIGDSELIIVRANEIFRAHPLTSSHEFNSSPILISSKKLHNYNLELGMFKARVVPGDDIVLVTDALGKYMLSQFEVGINPIESFQLIMQTDSDHIVAYKSWIGSLRKGRLLKNDDSTMIWIHLFNN